MVLLNSVVEVATCPVAHLPAEFSTDGSGIRIMAICRDAVWRHARYRTGGSKERLGSDHVTVLT
jgi:hypothetical protein